MPYTATFFALNSGNSSPDGICSGPDGNLWVCDNYSTKQVWKVTTGGVGTNYSFVATRTCICSDGTNLWVTDEGPASFLSYFWKFTTSGSGTKYDLNTVISTASSPNGICYGPDGNLWIADVDGTVWAAFNEWKYTCFI